MNMIDTMLDMLRKDIEDGNIESEYAVRLNPYETEVSVDTGLASTPLQVEGSCNLYAFISPYHSDKTNVDVELRLINPTHEINTHNGIQVLYTLYKFDELKNLFKDMTSDYMFRTTHHYDRGGDR